MMTTPDRPLFTAQVVEASKPELITLDLAEHKIIEKTSQQWLREVGRERFWSKFDSIIGGLAYLGGTGAFGLGVFNWINTGQIEVPSVFGVVGIFFSGARILSERGKKLMQRANAIEQAFNPNIKR